MTYQEFGKILEKVDCDSVVSDATSEYLVNESYMMRLPVEVYAYHMKAKQSKHWSTYILDLLIADFQYCNFYNDDIG